MWYQSLAHRMIKGYAMSNTSEVEWLNGPLVGHLNFAGCLLGE
jgi:hypothetical protein